MEFLAHSLIGLLAFFPSILLLFGIYLLWEQARQTNKQLDAIARLLTDIHQQQRGTTSRPLPENR
jgi:predicted tellurium resistance membrane protein TerC